MNALRLRAAGGGELDAGERVADEHDIALFRALSDPVRWNLVVYLARNGRTPRSEVETRLCLSKTMLSYHARTLARVGLIDVHGSARALSYTVRREALVELRRRLADPGPALPAGQEEESACGRR